MKNLKKIVSVMLVLGFFSGTALSATKINWWHAFKGRLGTLLAEQVDQFNAAQNDYEIIQICKKERKKRNCIANLKERNINLLKGKRIKIPIIPFKR